MKKAARTVVIDVDARRLSRVVSRVKELGWFVERQYLSYRDFETELKSGATSLSEIDAILLDQSSNDSRTVLEIAEELLERDPWLILILVLNDDISRCNDLLIQAWEAGYYWFLESPSSSSEQYIEPLGSTLFKQRLESRKNPKYLAHENKYLRSALKGRKKFPYIIGDTPVMKELKREILEAAEFGGPTVIIGESGTGKELVARAIHRNDPSRSRGEFIAENCAAINATLFESHFFGHKQGAFTHATSDRKGLFMAADSGTLFLDEITEIPIELQSKFLRAIDGYEFNPVGGDKSMKSDARILVASNRDLLEAVEAGDFRQDLYYRLMGYQIRLPSLRERFGDIPVLVNHFYSEFSEERGFASPKPSNEVLKYLSTLEWEGNVRQLRSFVEQLAFRMRKKSYCDVDQVSSLYNMLNSRPTSLLHSNNLDKRLSRKLSPTLNRWENSIKIASMVLPELILKSVPNAMTIFAKCKIVSTENDEISVSNTDGEVFILTPELSESIAKARFQLSTGSSNATLPKQTIEHLRDLKEQFGVGQNNVSKYKKEHREALKKLMTTDDAKKRWPLLTEYWITV